MREGQGGQGGQGGHYLRLVRLVRPLPFLLLAILPACRGTLSPLSNRLKIGQEPYLVFVADGENGVGDLFASPAAGGTAFQLTFTRVDERAPALSPDGSMVAFVRARAPGDTSGAAVVVFNLVNGAERRIPAQASAVAWSADGASLYLQTSAGLMVTPAPPAATALTSAAGAAEGAADSALRVLLGDPPLGEAMTCDGGTGVCARLAGGEVTTLSAQGRGPARWGTDSVAWLERDGAVVRPLGGGTTRQLRWTSPVAHPRSLTYFAGQPSGMTGGAGRDTSP